MEKRSRRDKNFYLCVSAVCLSVSILVLAGVILFVFGIGNNTNNTSNVNESTSSVETTKPDEQGIEYFTISTSYGNLYYPQKWEENLRIEVTDEEPDIVKFFAKFEGKEELQLFDIIFNGEGTAIKTLTLKDGSTVSVSIKPYETEFDDTWSDEEQVKIMEMREDVNYLFDKLSELEK